MASPLATALMTSEALPKTNISPTNLVGTYQMASDAAMNRYKAQLAQKMGTWGGLASLGGTTMGALAPRMFDKAFPSASAVPDYSSGIIGAAGDGGVAGEGASIGGMAGFPAAEGAGTVAAELGAPAAAEGAGSVAAGMGAAEAGAAEAGAAGMGAAEAGASMLPEWLMEALPFILAL